MAAFASHTTGRTKSQLITKPSGLPALTIARFFAAMSVVWYHFGRFVPMPAWATNVTMSGYVWVTFFFMLSGFILVYAVRDLTTAEGRRDFYVRRAARILPVYLLAWVLFAVCQLIDPAITMKFWLKTMAIFGGLGLTFAQGWVPGAAQYWNTPAWSLSCEAFFYLCFPAIFLMTLTMKRRDVWNVLLALTVVGVFIVLAIHELKDEKLMAGTAFATTWAKFLSFHPAVQLVEFVIGMMLGKLYVMGPRLKHARAWLAFSIAALCGLALLEYGDVRRDLLLVPVFSLLIYALACLPNAISGRTATLGVLLGNASFGIYILQEPLWYLYCSVLGIPRWGSTASLGVVAAFLALLVGACVVIYLKFERPADVWIKSRAGVPRRAPAGAVAVPL